jgi:hypothetical protein
MTCVVRVGEDAVEKSEGLTVVVAEAEATAAVTAVAVAESLATVCVAVAVAAVAMPDEVATASEAVEAEAVVVSLVEPVAPPVALPLPLLVDVRPKAASSWNRQVSDYNFAMVSGRHGDLHRKARRPRMSGSHPVFPLRAGHRYPI